MKTSKKGISSAPPQLTPEAELALIQKALKHPAREYSVYWLDTGDKYLNSVLGSTEQGIPYGKLIEAAGWESHGKTALLYRVAGVAQKDGARIGIWDLEEAWDPEWAIRCGLDPENVIIFRPVVGFFGNEKKKRPITAEEQAEQVEMWLDRCNEQNPNGRIFLGVDSIAAIAPAEEEEASISAQNMRTKISTASFLSFLLRRWQKRAASYNALVFVVNQIRVKPGVAFGNPEYTPGGNALRFYCSIRVKIRRKGGKILKDGKAIGFKGVIDNWKNKAGGGSKEGRKIGFKQYYTGKVKYVPFEDIKRDPE